MVHRNFVDGSWLEGVAASHNVNPSNTDDVVGEYAQADAAQAQSAVAAAKAAFPGWRAATPQQRADALDRIGIEILARKRTRPDDDPYKLIDAYREVLKY